MLAWGLGRKKSCDAAASLLEYGVAQLEIGMCLMSILQELFGYGMALWVDIPQLWAFPKRAS